jgi:predicted nucleic acid-binding protein
LNATFVDANVLLDVLTNDPVWAEWSLRRLDTAAVAGPLLINDVIYAEVSVGFTPIERVEESLTRARVELVAIPRPALFLAGKTFRRYRAAGGPRTNVLPDFFIGAHAAVLGCALLTRDARRYRTYFPTIALVTP